MKLNRENYMTTGEFARRMGVTKETLFHYDKIGLFSPEIVRENKYRYYSIYQIEIFDAIIQLKELGMSLEQIREFLEHRSAEKIFSAFQKREEQIRLQIRELRRQRAWIHERMRRVLDMRDKDWKKIEKTVCSKQYFLYTPIEDKSDATFLKKMNQTILEFLEKNQERAYDIGCMQRAEDVENGIFDNYHNIILLTQNKPAQVKSSALEAGEYLCAYHKGSWETVGECYERLLSYAEKEKLVLEEPYIERYVIDHLLAEKAEDYVTQVFVRIENAKRV